MAINKPISNDPNVAELARIKLPMSEGRNDRSENRRVAAPTESPKASVKISVSGKKKKTIMSVPNGTLMIID